VLAVEALQAPADAKAADLDPICKWSSPQVMRMLERLNSFEASASV
jgi:hypothetical protein